MKSKPWPWSLRPKTAAGAQAIERYQSIYDARRAALQGIALFILVWGPGPNGDPIAVKKRQEIRQALIDAGHEAYFSEQLIDSTLPLSLKAQEFLQAQASDLIVILLVDAAGPIAEEEFFGNHPDIVTNIYVHAPSHHKDDYLGQGSLRLLDDGYGGVRWYVPEDLRDCHVVGATLRRAEARREIRALYQPQRRGRR